MVSVASASPVPSAPGRFPRPVVAVDSDGTVLDAMTPKHRGAFAPALVDVWGLRDHAEAVEAEFIALNLFSPFRGVNRFTALGVFLREAAGRYPGLENTGVLISWTQSAATLSEAALAEAARETGDRAMARAVEWSREVNRRCACLPGPAPFSGAADALRRVADSCRLVVVSSGAGATIRGEWAHAGLGGLPERFLTQESGTKETVLRGLAAEAGGGRRVIMVGDAPPDLAAARSAGARFFPIVPGAEQESWELFSEKILPRFIEDDLADPELDCLRENWERALGDLAPV